MHFVYPQFLWALGLLAVPLALHLFAFRRYKTVYFSNVALLKEVQQQQSSNRNLKKLLILLARLLALACLILAFAQPYLGKDATSGGERGHYRSLFIDNSPSMSAKNGAATQLDMAKQQAIALMRSGNDNDLFRIVTTEAGFSGDTWLDKNRAIRKIEEVVPSYSPFRFSENNSLFAPETEDGIPVEHYLFSDFQKTAGLPKTSDSAEVTFVQFQTELSGNLSVDTAWFAEPAIGIGTPVHLLVRFQNHGSGETALDYVVQINQRNSASRKRNIPAKNILLDTILLNFPQAGWQELEVKLTDPVLSFDNQFRLSAFAAPKQLATFEQDPACVPATNAVRVTGLFNLQPATGMSGDKEQISLSIVSPRNSSGFEWTKIKSMAEQGGVISLFPGFSALPSAWPDWLNVQVKGVLVSGAQLPVSELQQSWFSDVLIGSKPDLQMPEFGQYLDAGVINPALAEVLLRLDNGKPLLIRVPVGKGLVYLFTADLSAAYSNFSRHALFAPLIFKIAGSALGKSMVQNSFSGSLISLRNLEPSGDMVYHLKGNESDYIPRVVLKGNERFASVGDLPLVPGFYTLSGASDSVRLAVNPPLSESVTDFYQTEDLSKMGKVVELNSKNAGTAYIAPAILSDSTSFWKYLILASIAFFILEMLLLRFTKQ